MSIYKRPDSPHFWTEFVIQGHRIRRSTETGSRREAEQFERRLRQQIRDELKNPSPRSQLTLDDACGRYWLEVGSRRRDSRDVHRWITYVLRYLSREALLSDLSGSQVAEFVSAMRADGIGEISINRTVTTLQGVHNRAAKVWEEPVKVIGWKPHKTRERSREHWITHDQARALLDAMQPETRALVWFMLLTGIRRKEAFNLTWDRVDDARGVIIIEAKGGIMREVDLSPEAGLILASQNQGGRYVFDSTGWRKRFEKAKTAAGLSTLRWHDLRHTCATWLGQSGAPLDVIRQQLGHSSITVTQKYRHVARAEVRAALQQVPTISPTLANVIPIKARK